MEISEVLFVADPNNKSINNEHDVGYKFLFSHKNIFIQLLNSFINLQWEKDIDEKDLSV